MFWKKVVIIIYYLLSAKRTFMMSSPKSRSGSRMSRSRSRSRSPARRRSSRSRSQSGSEGECYGGSGQDNSFPPPGDGLYGLASIHWGAKGFPLNKKRRRSISEDSDAPRLHTSIALVPLKFSRHAEDLLIKLQRSLTSEDRSKKRPP